MKNIQTAKWNGRTGLLLHGLWRGLVCAGGRRITTFCFSSCFLQ